MDVTRMLEADHRMVEGLFAKIEATEGEERAALVTELASALHDHMELEERILYPAMIPVVGKETVQEGVTEHELARRTLEDMVALSPDEPGFGGALEAVKAGIEHHVDEEEHEVFPKLRTEGAGVLEQIAEPFKAKRASLDMKVNVGALTEGATKDQLLEEAKGLDIAGASSMNKDELAEALAASG